MSFTPKTRLEKILCGVATTAKTRLEKAVAEAMASVGSGGSGGSGAGELLYIPFDVAEGDNDEMACSTSMSFNDIKSAYLAGKALFAKVSGLPSAYLIMPLSFVVMNDDDPGAFAFNSIVNFAGTGEDPSMVDFSITITSSDCAVGMIPLAVPSEGEP